MAIYKRPVHNFRTTNSENLLVVDDLPQMRDMMRVMLKKNGYVNLTMAESGKQAIKSLAGHPIDLVITDWSMPNMTGIELLKYIKGDPNLYLTPVLMISDERSTEKVLYAVEEGTDGFLVKPFSENDLIKKIKAALVKNASADLIEQKINEMRRLKLSKDYRGALEMGVELLKVTKNQRVALMTCECLYQVEEYDKAIARMPDTEEKDRSSQHSNLLGKIHLNLGQYSQGIIALEQAVKMNPLNYDRKIDLAGAYFANGKAEEAERVIQSIVNARPTDLELVSIAQIYLDQDQTDKAGQYLKQTVDPIKETVSVFNNYAVALRRANRLEDATDIYLRCLKIDPDSDVLHYNLAVLYLKSGKAAEGKAALENAVKLNPDNQYAKDLLQKLGK
ncbi:MAG: response regulator [Deltaproteobacteria bacterium]|nr:response regulator [Deltaproteobacteria bacterium]